MDGKQLSRQYKEHFGGFKQWEQLDHASEFVCYPKNIGPRLSMDETCLSQDEVYTIITNKDGKGRKGSLVAMIKGTSSDTVIRVLQACLRESQRRLVKEITVDLSPSMMLIARRSFPKATLINDRFHVQKLMNEAVDELRIKFRWEMMEQENDMIRLAKETGHKYTPERLRNGETKRQLLVRARKLLFKNRSKWTQSQKQRAEILFEYYPQLEYVYDLSMELTTIFNTVTQKGVALARFARWYDKVESLALRNFDTVIQTIQNHYQTISNYFENRATNASAESFNAKIKAFRSQFRGVADIPFFIFRLTKLFA